MCNFFMLPTKNERNLNPKVIYENCILILVLYISIDWKMSWRKWLRQNIFKSNLNLLFITASCNFINYKKEKFSIENWSMLFHFQKKALKNFFFVWHKMSKQICNIFIIGNNYWNVWHILLSAGSTQKALSFWKCFFPISYLEVITYSC